MNVEFSFITYPLLEHVPCPGHPNCQSHFSQVLAHFNPGWYWVSVQIERGPAPEVS
jgi:hypothetical protein